MKRLFILITILTVCFSNNSKINGVTYFDYTTNNNESAFNFNRQYFNYTVSNSDDLTFKVVFDVGRTNYIDNEDTRLVTFLKKAQIDYTCSLGKTSLGMIGMNTYGVQEHNWGYRFIEKAAIDLNKFSSTADLGIGFSKIVIENLNLSLQIVNGEGYKKPQGNKYHKISFNTTYGNSKLNTNNGYNLGLIYSRENSDEDPITMMSLFGGYSITKIRFALDYNILTTNKIEKTLISLTINYALMDKIKIFVRYDMIDDNNDIELNGENYLIAGLVFNCKNGLTVSPNIRVKSFEKNTIDSNHELKVNFQFKF